MYLPTRLWLDADDSADLAQYETDLNNYVNYPRLKSRACENESGVD